MPNVKLAIRLRPFTERESRSEKDRVQIVNVVDDTTVTITNLKVSASGAGDSRERVRRYHADYTFDSACPQNLPEYASQEKVFERIGRDVLSSLSRLSSVCVLAYGQSATGKTHTMMGTDAEPGLVPRLCRELAGVEPCDVTVSFLEIYNERVHDLLVGEDPPLTFNSLPRRRGNARKDLRVREHPTRGPYVQNLRRVAVSTVDSLLGLVWEGARRRRTAATRRNSASSRSHALLELTTPSATLHLADLAGSEKASWEGCCGGRQKEGANINKSLVALSNVISALVSSSGRGRFVPYRDSALTWLLRDCFTGGACTFVIATVSPSVACYGESASTLRWSSRARQLPSPRALPPPRAAIQAHYNNLLAELCRHHIRYIPETGRIFYEDCHWALQSKHDVANQLGENSDNNANIGNLLNMLQPKTDNNSEPIASSHVSSDTSDSTLLSVDKNVNIANEINKEVDKLLAPAFERTRSGSELEIVAPLRNKRRQYRSQEVLTIEKTLQDPSPRQSQAQMIICKTDDTAKNSRVDILHDNQRAEIVASVTERLYSKLKKKEEAAVSKVESMVDKKIMEPLSELKICTNARQRLMELSQKAIRNKRRIGIPAHTQTRKIVVRVKDQGIDVQTDLESYGGKDRSSFIVYRDASTETKPMTARSKEIAVGPKCGSLFSYDKSTATENKPVVLKSAFVMTDESVKLNKYTQTKIVPPPRRKRAICSNKSKSCHSEHENEYLTTPIISINISQRYVESESQSSDDNLEITNFGTTDETINAAITPDLLTNHSNVEPVSKEDIDQFVINVDRNQISSSDLKVKLKEEGNSSGLIQNVTEDFPEEDELTLPRGSVNCSSKDSQNEIKNIILGRNENLYPYNIVFSPPREKDNTKRIVKFEDHLSSPAKVNDVDTKLNDELKNKEKINCVKNSGARISVKDNDDNSTSIAGNSSDSLESGRVDSDSFIWKKGEAYNNNNHITCQFKNARYTPAYKSSSKYKTTKSRLYREYLGLAKEDPDERQNRIYESLNSDSTRDWSSSESIQADHPQYKFLQSKQFFENQYKRYDTPNDNYDKLEKQIYDACNSLDLSADKYERYLGKYRRNSTVFTERTSKKYLQHLVQIRKEVIKADSDTTDT